VVSLAEEGAETVLTYTAKAEIGGKIATLGGRLMQSTSRKLADEFFGKFAAELTPAGDPTAPAPAAA
jgi:carbon monoxide dehydrogenase subunit G